MRNTLLLIFVTVFQVHADDAYSQNTKLSLKLNNVTVANVLEEIQNKSEFYFLFNAKLIDVGRDVSISVENKKISDILSSLFSGTGINYLVYDRQIILTPSDVTAISDAIQQQNKLTGTVTDKTGSPLPGVNIVVTGTTQGIITDIAGKYSIEVPQGSKSLTFTFVGMEPQEIIIGTRTQINVTMAESAIGLEEVVVIGYGTTKKVDLTGSVSAISFTESMDSRPLPSLSSGLAGMSAGLVVKQNSSAPGNESVSVLIRGVGTLNNSAPLVLIDGIAGNIDDVNPNDVANISVLKDAASSAIYGSRAANGVILITTKRGKAEKMSVTYNGYVGIESAANMIDFISDYPTHMELLNEATQNSGQPLIYNQTLIDEWRTKSMTDPANYPNTDWFREILKPSVNSEHNLSIRGGSEKSNFLLSLGYLDNKGVVENAEYQKYSFRLNVDSKVTDWLSLGQNIFGFWSDRGPADASYLFSTMLQTNPGILPKSSDGRYGGSMMAGEVTGAYNPRAYMENATGNNERQRIGIQFFAKIKFLKYFEFETNFAGNYDNRRSWQYTGPVSIWDLRANAKLYDTATRNNISNSNSRYYSTTLNELLRFNYSLNNAHHISALLGFDQEYSRQDQFSAAKLDLLNDAIYVIDAASADPTASGTAEDWALRSYFGRINYDYKGKYLFEANGRSDGSSRFSKDNRWGFFPSFSAGWRFSEESFYEPLKKWINNAKLRASWGKLGNNSIGNYEYQSLYGGQNYSFGGSIAQGISPTSLSNPDITWEETTTSDIGLDLNIFKNKLSVSADVFEKTTENILVRLPIPLVMGNLNAPNQNVARVRNRGWEGQLSYMGNVGKDFEYSIGGNISFIDNKVLKYKGSLKEIKGNNVLTEGESIWRFYIRELDHIVQDQAEIDKMIADGYTFSPAIPKPGDFLYKDTNADKKINDDDRIIQGSTIPKATYGINISASYKGIDLNILGQGVTGLDYFNGGGTYNTFNLHWGYIQKESVLNRWTPENRSTSYPRLTYGLSNNDIASDYWLKDVSFFRIKSFQLGYAVPKRITSKFQIDRLRLYTSLENYFTFTSYDGFDPENAGVTYPNMKQFIVGLNITF